MAAPIQNLPPLGEVRLGARLRFGGRYLFRRFRKVVAGVQGTLGLDDVFDLRGERLMYAGDVDRETRDHREPFGVEHEPRRPEELFGLVVQQLEELRDAKGRLRERRCPKRRDAPIDRQ